MSALPSATYAGAGETDNLWLPANGSATIRGNLVVTGSEQVGTGITGLGGAGLVVPSGAVGGARLAPTPLPLPKGFFISDLGNAPSVVVAGATAGGAFLVDFQHGIRTQESALLAQGGGSVNVGSASAQSILILNAGPGNGTLASPVPLAPGAVFQMNTNKSFIRVTSAGSVTVAPPGITSGGVPSVWCFTDNTQPIQNYFRSDANGVITLTAVGGAQTFGVLVL